MLLNHCNDCKWYVVVSCEALPQMTVSLSGVLSTPQPAIYVISILPTVSEQSCVKWALICLNKRRCSEWTMFKALYYLGNLDNGWLCTCGCGILLDLCYKTVKTTNFIIKISYWSFWWHPVQSTTRCAAISTELVLRVCSKWRVSFIFIIFTTRIQ